MLVLFLRLLGKFRDHINALDLAEDFWRDDRILDYWLLLHGCIRRHSLYQGNHEVVDVLFMWNTSVIWHVVSAKRRKTRRNGFLIYIWFWLRIQVTTTIKYRVIKAIECFHCHGGHVLLVEKDAQWSREWKHSIAINHYSFCTLHFKRVRPKPSYCQRLKHC